MSLIIREVNFIRSMYLKRKLQKYYVVVIQPPFLGNICFFLGNVLRVVGWGVELFLKFTKGGIPYS